ncbi:MAG: hypothetical protein K2L57_05135 [Muribaculaceae bacterium]|nr:hypothetical protein [Muribaculaceae bacterium]
MRPRHILPLIAMLLVVLAFSCGSRVGYGDVFTEAEKRIAEHPDSATSYLDSLAADTTWTKDMRESDRARFSLLRVKAADKAYVRHTSDSLIRTALAYYENHTGSDHYPEALYYGGRVYSDLGDSPTALRYFQTALDAVPEKGAETQRTKVLSQTGRLMNRMRMYDEAIRYLDEAIRIESMLKDSVSLAYDYELSGAIFLHVDSLDRAKERFRKALALCRPESSLWARQYTYLAAAELNGGDPAEAVRLIRGMPARISGTYRSTSMGYAAMIYLEAGQYDSARFYAERILDERDPRNRRIAYSVLLSPNVKETLHPDSVEKYYVRYGEEVSEFAENNNREACAVSNAIYNYGLHDRRRQQAEDEKMIYAIAGLCLLLALFVMSLVTVVIRHRHNRNRLELYEALDNIRTLRGLLESAHPEREEKEKDAETDNKADVDTESCHDKTSGLTDAETEEERLRTTLRKELLGLIAVSSKYSRPSKNCVVPDSIAKSDAYKYVCRCLETGTALPPDGAVWHDLKMLAREVWPSLQDRLDMLAGSHIKEKDYRLCLLIKLGFSPTDITVLTGRTKGTISSRRARLCREILGENAGAGGFDIVILSL